MAGDSPEARVRLRELGVLAPLVALLRAAPVPTQREVRVEPSAGLRRTAAWALCNMMRGGETPARPFVDAGADLHEEVLGVGGVGAQPRRDRRLAARGVECRVLQGDRGRRGDAAARRWIGLLRGEQRRRREDGERGGVVVVHGG
jgi:hypothetical protein